MNHISTRAVLLIIVLGLLVCNDGASASSWFCSGPLPKRDKITLQPAAASDFNVAQNCAFNELVVASTLLHFRGAAAASPSAAVSITGGSVSTYLAVGGIASPADHNLYLPLRVVVSGTIIGPSGAVHIFGAFPPQSSITIQGNTITGGGPNPLLAPLLAPLDTLAVHTAVYVGHRLPTVLGAAAVLDITSNTVSIATAGSISMRVIATAALLLEPAAQLHVRSNTIHAQSAHNAYGFSSVLTYENAGYTPLVNLSTGAIIGLTDNVVASTSHVGDWVRGFQIGHLVLGDGAVLNVSGNVASLSAAVYSTNVAALWECQNSLQHKGHFLVTHNNVTSINTSIVLTVLARAELRGTTVVLSGNTLVADYDTANTRNNNLTLVGASVSICQNVFRVLQGFARGDAFVRFGLRTAVIGPCVSRIIIDENTAESPPEMAAAYALVSVASLQSRAGGVLQVSVCDNWFRGRLFATRAQALALIATTTPPAFFSALLPCNETPTALPSASLSRRRPPSPTVAQSQSHSIRHTGSGPPTTSTDTLTSSLPAPSSSPRLSASALGASNSPSDATKTPRGNLTQTRSNITRTRHFHTIPPAAPTTPPQTPVPGQFPGPCSSLHGGVQAVVNRAEMQGDSVVWAMPWPVLLWPAAAVQPLWDPPTGAFVSACVTTSATALSCSWSAAVPEGLYQWALPASLLAAPCANATLTLAIAVTGPTVLWSLPPQRVVLAVAAATALPGFVGDPLAIEIVAAVMLASGPCTSDEERGAASPAKYLLSPLADTSPVVMTAMHASVGTAAVLAHGAATFWVASRNAGSCFRAAWPRMRFPSASFAVAAGLFPGAAWGVARGIHGGDWAAVSIGALYVTALPVCVAAVLFRAFPQRRFVSTGPLGGASAHPARRLVEWLRTPNGVWEYRMFVSAGGVNGLVPLDVRAAVAWLHGWGGVRGRLLHPIGACLTVAVAWLTTAPSRTTACRGYLAACAAAALAASVLVALWRPHRHALTSGLSAAGLCLLGALFAVFAAAVASPNSTPTDPLEAAKFPLVVAIVLTSWLRLGHICAVLFSQAVSQPQREPEARDVDEPLLREPRSQEATEMQPQIQEKDAGS